MSDPNRCAVCGWPLAQSLQAGCVRGNCSMRPLPGRYYDAERAQREYGWPLPAEDPPTPTEKAISDLGAQAEALIAERDALRVEVDRLKRGAFTPDEFQALCHHRDEQPGCTRADFVEGCRQYQAQLFGPPPERLEVYGSFISTGKIDAVTGDVES